MKEAAAKIRAGWLPVHTNEFGTPLLNSAFEQAREAARHRLLCYINADIVLLSDFLPAIQNINLKRFLVGGQRWNLDVSHPLDFEDPEWERRIRQRVSQEGVLYPVYGMDYFVFPRESELTHLPAFAVGRPKWDNWMIFNARRLGIPVIDVTQGVTVVHQNHDYAHVKDRKGTHWEGAEADRNLALAGGENCLLNLADSTHVLKNGRVRAALDYEHVRRRLTVATPILHPRLRPLVNALSSIRKWLKLPL